MHDREGPRATCDVLGFGLTAEIHIVEMKVEALIERETRIGERFTMSGQQQAVEQLYLLAGRAKHIEAARWKARAMADDSAEVLRCVPGEFIIDKRPSGLARDAAFIARKTYDLKTRERIHKLIDPIEIEKVNVVVSEDHHGGIGRGLANDAVVELRQTASILGKQPNFKKREVVSAQ